MNYYNPFAKAPGARAPTARAHPPERTEPDLNITMVGMGAIGGLMGARLASAGGHVSALARGATLAALQARGMDVQHADGSPGISGVPIHAVSDANASALGPQDLVVIAVKATQLPAVAASITPLIGPSTLVMTAMNGVPWWFFGPGTGDRAGLTLPSLDPDGALARVVPIERTLGCVVHLSAACPQPGAVRLNFGNRLLVGPAIPAQAGLAAAARPLMEALTAGGFDAAWSDGIRRDIWYKLWGNMTINPISVLTGATADRILDDPLLHRFCLSAMAEASAIGALIGCPIVQTGAERMAVTRELGAFKTSMLLDAEIGKALEIDALITVVHDIGLAVGVATPAIDILLGLIRLHGRCHGLYPESAVASTAA